MVTKFFQFFFLKN